ncbi:MAG TPA: HlyC/CorC family transporter [Candidatus Enterenecus merdae]|nr:HlyC/CorC family transporter [Candidatus Enterenecus merdae]
MLILIVLTAINAFFAAAEIAVISLSETKLKKQAEEGDRKSAKLLALMQAPDNFLSAIQIAITLAGFLNAAFAADSFADPLVEWLVLDVGFTALPVRVLNTLMVVLVTILLSYFTLVLGELVPKRVAMKKTEGVARATVGVVTAVAKVFRPVIWLLSKSTNGVLRLMHIDPKADEENVSEDEIRMMVDLGEERGAIQSNEKELIDNIFEFNNTTAEDVMVHRTDMVMVWVDDPPEEIIRTIRDSGISRFPVYDEDADDIVGILNTRDYLLNAQLPKPKALRELLRSAYFVPESVRTDVLFRDMQSKKVHLAIVVDEYGGTSGLVTMEDLLEEIVGNIYDEFDPQEEKDIEQVDQNLWRISGSCDLEQVAEALEMEFPDDVESDTLGGLVFAQLSAIPQDGSQLEVDACGLHIKVLELTDRRVEWALVSKLAPTPAPEQGP